MDKEHEMISSYWNEAAEGFDAQHDTEDVALWREALEGAVGLNGNGATLDVGCGTGFLALMLAELGMVVNISKRSAAVNAAAKQKAEEAAQ